MYEAALMLAASLSPSDLLTEEGFDILDFLSLVVVSLLSVCVPTRTTGTFGQ